MSGSERCGVYVVDDHEGMRSLAKTLIDLDNRMWWVGESDNGIDAVREILDRRPDAVLLDVEMPGMDGLEVLLAVRAAAYQGAIVLFSSSAEAMRSGPSLGADASFTKTTRFATVIEGIVECCHRRRRPGEVDTATA